MIYPKVTHDKFGNRTYYEQNEPELWAGWMKYDRDERGNCLYYVDSNGIEKWMTYNEHNKLLSFITSIGYSERFLYDENDKLIQYKNSLGTDILY